MQVRIELPNKTKQLRPGMYANVAFTGQTHEALSVPTESIIVTGKRKIVIVKESRGYRPVELITGQERDSFTEALSGVSEGEQVVVSGQFLIDSEASLSGVLARLSQQDKAVTKMDATPMDNAKPTAVQKMPKGHGKVVEVDAMSGKLILNHEPIAELGWPAMTMGFKVKESKQLEKLKVGDAVTFDLKAEASEQPDMPAQYRIERIEKAAAMQDGMKGEKP